MDRACALAKRDGVPEVVILEESSKKLNRIFLTEPHSKVLKTSQGDQIVEQMKKWFSK